MDILSKKRIEWIDMAKGLGMILVMLAHAPFPNSFIKEIYTFHMPLFFLLSGLLFSVTKYNSFKKFFIKKVKSLLVPYFALSFINYLYWIYSFYYSKQSMMGPAGAPPMGLPPSAAPGVLQHMPMIPQIKVTIFTPLIGTFYAIRNTPYTQHNGTLWFVACLFFTEIIFYFIVKFAGDNSKKIAATLLLFSILGYTYSTYVGIILPWSVDAALTAVVFLGIGYLIKKNKSKLDKCIQIKYLLILLIFNFTLGLFNKKIDMFSNTYGDYFLFYTSAIAGILAIIVLIRLLPKISIFTYIGKNSLIFLAIHQFVLFPLIEKMLRNINFLNGNSILILTIKGVSYTLIASILLVPIVYIINNYLPFILGKSFPKKETITSTTSSHS